MDWPVSGANGGGRTPAAYPMLSAAAIAPFFRQAHDVASAFDCGICGRHSGGALYILDCPWHVRPRLCEPRPTLLQAARFGGMQSQMAARFRVVRWQELKTEFTQVQLDCLDAQKQRRLVLVLVWLFGVRKLVSNEIYPASYDNQWPQECP